MGEFLKVIYKKNDFSSVYLNKGSNVVGRSLIPVISPGDYVIYFGKNDIRGISSDQIKEVASRFRQNSVLSLTVLKEDCSLNFLRRGTEIPEITAIYGFCSDCPEEKKLWTLKNPNAEKNFR